MTRKEIIAKAKDDIKYYSEKKHESGYLYFAVKRKQRKVIGYTLGTYVDDTHSNITTAKCDKHDVFNEYIGKAIVARKIFGAEVPDYYLNTPQPESCEWGYVVINKTSGTIYAVANYNHSVREEAFESNNGKGKRYCTGRMFSLELGSDCYIIDDTNYLNNLSTSQMPNSTPPILSCYDRQKHTCGGGCQGASDCIMAQWYRDQKESKPTKKEMKEYIKLIKKGRREWNKCKPSKEELEQLMNDPKIRELLKQ